MWGHCTEPKDMIEVLQPHVRGRKWILTTEGAAFQPEGLWPEGWNAVPEVVNDTYARKHGVGVTFMFCGY